MLQAATRIENPIRGKFSLRAIDFAVQDIALHVGNRLIVQPYLVGMAAAVVEGVEFFSIGQASLKPVTERGD